MPNRCMFYDQVDCAWNYIKTSNRGVGHFVLCHVCSACGARWRSCCPQTGLGRSHVRTRPSSGGQVVLVREDRAVLREGGGGDRGDGEV